MIAQGIVRCIVRLDYKLVFAAMSVRLPCLAYGIGCGYEKAVGKFFTGSNSDNKINYFDDSVVFGVTG
jgi:hypothetical protein